MVPSESLRFISLLAENGKSIAVSGTTLAKWKSLRHPETKAKVGSLVRICLSTNCWPETFRWPQDVCTKVSTRLSGVRDDAKDFWSPTEQGLRDLFPQRTLDDFWKQAAVPQKASVDAHVAATITPPRLPQREPSAEVTIQAIMNHFLAGARSQTTGIELHDLALSTSLPVNDISVAVQQLISDKVLEPVPGKPDGWHRPVQMTEDEWDDVFSLRSEIERQAADRLYSKYPSEIDRIGKSLAKIEADMRRCSTVGDFVVLDIRFHLLLGSFSRPISESLSDMLGRIRLCYILGHAEQNVARVLEEHQRIVHCLRGRDRNVGRLHAALDAHLVTSRQDLLFAP